MFDSWTVDQLETVLVEAEHRIGRLRAMQMALLDRLDVAQVARSDGARSLTEWVAGRADLDRDTARELVRTTRTTAERPELRQPLANGATSFARCAATARLAAAGATEATITASSGHDIAGVRRLASRHRRHTPTDERQAFERRHLMLQPSLDHSMGRIYGEFTGYDWSLIHHAITEAADTFPTHPDQPASAAQRRADALTAICHDALDPHPGGDTASSAASRVPLVTVFVDTTTGPPGHLDAATDTGIRVGTNRIDGILCQGASEAIETANGTPLARGRTTRTIPPKLRRYILHRDRGCTIDGCTSRYRLQPHHIIPWSQGGSTDPDNLTTLCWYHHHVVVHGRGYRIDPDTPPQRRRLLKPHFGRAPPCRTET